MPAPADLLNHGVREALDLVVADAVLIEQRGESQAPEPLVQDVFAQCNSESRWQDAAKSVAPRSYSIPGHVGKLSGLHDHAAFNINRTRLIRMQLPRDPSSDAASLA